MQPERKLVRNTNDSYLGGVCSGIANYLNLDVTLVRALTVIAVVFSAGSVFLAYIILWAIVPTASDVYGAGAWGATQCPEGQQQAAFNEAYAQGYQQAQQDAMQQPQPEEPRP